MSFQPSSIRFKEFDSSGNPLAAGRLYTYASGTTTHKAVYTDATLGAPQSYTTDGSGNKYITLDARGECRAWLTTGAYTFVVTDSAGANSRTTDGIADTGATYDAALRADLLDTTSATKGDWMIGVKLVDAGGVDRTQHDKNADRKHLKDFGAALDGTTNDNTAWSAALVWATANAPVEIDCAGYGASKVTVTQEIPAGVMLNSPNLLVAADVVGMRLIGEARINKLKIRFSGAHTKNGLEVGDLTYEAGRSVVNGADIQGAGNDGIQVRYGNLGTLRDIKSVSNGRDGICFTKENSDTNAWRMDGFHDLRGNVRDGLHFEQGTSASDAFASKCHEGGHIITQNNGRYGVYVGTRSNCLTVYSEANTTKDIYIDTYGYGTRMDIVEGEYTDLSLGSMIRTHSFAATYGAGYSSKLFLSGVAGMGARLSNDDGVAGYLDFEKTGANTFEWIGGGTSLEQTIKFRNSAAPTAYMTGLWGGNFKPDTDNTFTLGSSALRWSVVYAGTGAINTSDQTEKQDIQALSAAETLVAQDIKALMRRFRFKNAVAEKGDAARLHFGVMAQSVAAAFAARGLDPHRYALFCSDTWDEGGETRTRLGIRYDELLCFVMAAA